jgi:hypothetical protein
MMNRPSDELAAILKRESTGMESATETFWRIVYWASGEEVTDQEIHSLPERWQRRIIEALVERPSTREAHPNYLRHACPGEWTEDRMAEVRRRRDRAFSLLEQVLLTRPPDSR